MRFKVLGAAGEVTGSNYLLEVGGGRVLVDCGLHQGRDEEEKNREPFRFAPSSIDAVLLTHAHMDHTGRAPLLVKQGFRGKIYATLPTVQLTEVLWTDSIHIMREEAEWRSRKNVRRGLPPIEPLYDQEDADRALELLTPVSYDDQIEVIPGLKVRFRDAGHILGSAILEIWMDDGDEHVKIVFTGDLGPQDTVVGRNPAVISQADYVVTESTYGDRLHKTTEETRLEINEIAQQLRDTRGKILIPTFVVDRAQRVLYELMLLQEKEVLRPSVPIFFDSPMGIRTTEIYEEHMSLFSSEIQGHIGKGKNPFSPEGLRYVRSVEESRAVNDVANAIVLAGSGMCNGGRIIHHLKHGIWNPNNHVIFVGYQAIGTLGRRLVDGQKVVRIAGEDVTVKAKLHTINGFSAHADRRDLLKWASNFKGNPTFFVTHGEPRASKSLAEGLGEIGFDAVVPVVDQEFELFPQKKRAVVSVVVPESRSVDVYDEVSMVLDEIASVAGSMQEGLRTLADVEHLLPLLKSSKVLLETANEKGCVKKR